MLKRRSSHYQCCCRSCLAHSRSAVANFLYLQKRIFYCNNKQDLVSEKQLNSSPVFSKHLFTFRSLPLLLLLGLRSLSWTLNSFRFRFLYFHWWLRQPQQQLPPSVCCQWRQMSSEWTRSSAHPWTRSGQ